MNESFDFIWARRHPQTHTSTLMFSSISKVAKVEKRLVTVFPWERKGVRRVKKFFFPSKTGSLSEGFPFLIVSVNERKVGTTWPPAVQTCWTRSRSGYNGRGRSEGAVEKRGGNLCGWPVSLAGSSFLSSKVKGKWEENWCSKVFWDGGFQVFLSHSCLLSLSRFPVCFGSLKIGQISASTCHPFMGHQLAVFVPLQGQVAGVNFKEKGHTF